MASASTLFNTPLTILDIGQYNIGNRCNEHQLAPIFVSNAVLYYSTFKILYDYKYIFKRLTALILPM